MNALNRRRAAMNGDLDIAVTGVTWSGAGADKTSSTINATDRDVYIMLPFVEGDSRLVSTATASMHPARTRLAAQYTDSSLATGMGYYNPSTGYSLTSRPATSSCPYFNFNTEQKAIPRGRYGKLVLCKYGSDVFSSNDKFIAYVKAHLKIYCRK